MFRNEELAARVSLSFCLSIMAHESRFKLGASIMRTIRDMERDSNDMRTKPAAPFKRPPLLGLWHKHFFDARFLAGNYLLAASTRERVNHVMEAIRLSEGQPKETILSRLVAAGWTEPVERRFAEGKATGEWVVYLPRDGKNYYLACSKHRRSPDEQYQLLDGILATCTIDFPELGAWLEVAARNSNLHDEL
ncbi:hypothetical protein ACHMW7_03845 [Aminobacter sp. UC22_36]|uniref:hypothetical protein n=1 Tax=Aminobacter sp. UC22_36 TaxID=3374549 RepID=UPI003756F841